MNAIKQWGTRVAVCGMLMGTIGAAYAANPHFVGKVTATKNDATGTATLCFKVAGLGDNESIRITASASATATYVCRNAGGNCPNAENKKTVTGLVNTTQPFTATRNGQVEACLTLEPPKATGFTCPGNQQVVFSSVTYTDLKVTLGSSGPSASATPQMLSVDKGACPAP
ncbi:MAG TPA: hypothetical protein VF616_25390 [Duganella sp.]|uniref:hypothetical protein n=1 Tax=Duganella sp. TaxID=1904440 RepID=UPI002ECFF0A3